VLALCLSALLVRQEMERRRAAIEFQVFRVMTGIMDECAAGHPFDASLWRDLSGFGLYSESGAALVRYGTAPVSLAEPEMIPGPGLSDLVGSSMIIVRRTGAASGFDGSARPFRGPGGFGRLMAPMGDRMRGFMNGRMADRPPRNLALPAPTGFVDGFMFIDINVAQKIREGRFVLFLVVFFLAMFFAIIGVLVAYSRRIVGYRERERETAHLVQLGEAARTLAHEIKNPLGIIRVQCATLRRTISEERGKNVSVIEEETGRLALLTDRLRDFLNNSEGRPEFCDAKRFLDECSRRYEGQLDILPYEGPEVTVYIDPARMMQVLDNLIANAREASVTGDGADAAEGTDLSSGNGGRKLPELSLALRRNTACFTVADSGCGIAGEIRSRLFEPFFTTKARGSGIGLALARRFMEQARGSLSYADRPGGGSVFTASLPGVKREESDGR